VPGSYVETFDGEQIKLGQWEGKRRNEYATGKLSQHRIDALEAIPGWVWEPFKADFSRKLSALKQFVDREGHARVPGSYVETFDGEQIKLGQWVGARRNEYATGKLSQHRIDALEAIPGWEWDVSEADFQGALAALKQFVDREGHARVSNKHVETFDGEKLRLGYWVGTRRRDYAKGKLSQDRIDALEALPGWVWKARGK
jgi:hypothetical protein